MLIMSIDLGFFTKESTEKLPEKLGYRTASFHFQLEAGNVIQGCFSFSLFCFNESFLFKKRFGETIFLSQVFGTIAGTTNSSKFQQTCLKIQDLPTFVAQSVSVITAKQLTSRPSNGFLSCFW